METADGEPDPDHSYSASNVHHNRIKSENEPELPPLQYITDQVLPALQNIADQVEVIRPNNTFQDNAETTVKKKAKQTVENQKFDCPFCDEHFTRRFNVKRHIHRYHKGESTQGVDAGSCVCLECGYRCLRIVNLRDHLINCHDITFRMERVFFENYPAFETWKQLTEEKECCNFVKVSGSKLSKKEAKVQYFQCNRCGNYRSTGKGERRPKSQGTCKIDRNCTATMKVTRFTDGGITVDVCYTHYGHEKDPTHLRTGKASHGLVVLESTYIGKQIHNGHFESFGLPLNSVSPVPDCDDKWEVLSKDKNATFTVRKIIGPACKGAECSSRCAECSACLHLFVCSCLDSLIKDSICKHIHLVQRFMNTSIIDKSMRQLFDAEIAVAVPTVGLTSSDEEQVASHAADSIRVEKDVETELDSETINNEMDVETQTADEAENGKAEINPEIAGEVEIRTVDEEFVIWMSKTGPVENIEHGYKNMPGSNI